MEFAPDFVQFQSETVRSCELCWPDILNDINDNDDINDGNDDINHDDHDAVNDDDKAREEEVNASVTDLTKLAEGALLDGIRRNSSAFRCKIVGNAPVRLRSFNRQPSNHFVTGVSPEDLFGLNLAEVCNYCIYYIIVLLWLLFLLLLIEKAARFQWKTCGSYVAPDFLAFFNRNCWTVQEGNKLSRKEKAFVEAIRAFQSNKCGNYPCLFINGVWFRSRPSSFVDGAEMIS